MRPFVIDFLQVLSSLIWIGSTLTSVLCIGALVLGSSEALNILYFAVPLCVVSTIIMIRHKWMRDVWAWFIPSL